MFCFEQSFLCSEFNFKPKVGSHGLIFDSNPVQVFHYPSIILLKMNYFVTYMKNGVRDAGSTAEWKKLPLDGAAHWNFLKSASYVVFLSFCMF